MHSANYAVSDLERSLTKISRSRYEIYDIVIKTMKHQK